MNSNATAQIHVHDDDKNTLSTLVERFLKRVVDFVALTPLTYSLDRTATSTLR